MKQSRRHDRKTCRNTEDYRHVFAVRVHQLLKLGYDRLNPIDHRSHDEPSITGFLVESMKATLKEPPPEIEDWCDHFFVADDPPENTEGRTGKRRRRVDLFVESGRRPRHEFRFESKRLASAHPVSDYLGEDGVGCFLSGAYGPSDLDVGMLGYVQSDDEQSWANTISSVLSKSLQKHSVLKGGGWQRQPNFPTESTFRTRHFRKSSGTPVTIYHTLLRFC